MKQTMTATVVLAALLCSTAASAETISGSAALALAGVVATASPVLSAAERKAVDELFAGSSSNYKKTITVAADRIVCRAGNVPHAGRGVPSPWREELTKISACLMPNRKLN
jgi:Skp family chaperone for outer membrane proteins